MTEDYFFEPLKVYVVWENGDYTREQAQEFARTNERRAPVFWTLCGGPQGLYGVLFKPDGTERETTLDRVHSAA